jgi:hypothetical protein
MAEPLMIKEFKKVLKKFSFWPGCVHSLVEMCYIRHDTVIEVIDEGLFTSGINSFTKPNKKSVHGEQEVLFFCIKDITTLKHQIIRLSHRYLVKVMELDSIG